MANYFWVGGTGTWDNTSTTNWATSSGGAGSAGVPTGADTVTFDANSFLSASQTCTTSSTAVCSNLTIGAVANTPTFNFSAGVTVYGSISISGTATWSANPSITLAATATGKTVALGGLATAAFTNCYLVFNGSGGGWTMSDATYGSSNNPVSITLTAGSLNLNGKTYNLNDLTGGGSGTTLTFGAASVTFAKAGAEFNIATGGTFTLNTATFATANTAQTSFTFTGNGRTYNAFTQGNASDVITVGDASFSSYTKSGGVGNLTLGGNLTTSGNCTLSSSSQTSRMLVEGADGGSTITCSGSFTSNGCDYRNITMNTSRDLSAVSLGSGDCGGNSNIVFTSPLTWYLIGSSGTWSSASRFSASSGGTAGTKVPLPQDTVNIDSVASGSCTLSATLRMPNVVCAATTGSVTLAAGNTAVHWAGNVTLDGSTVITGTGVNRIGKAGATVTWTLNGKSLPIQPRVDPGSTGTVTFADNVTATAAMTVISGTVNFNGTFDTSSTVTVSGGAVTFASTYTSTSTGASTLSIAGGNVSITGAATLAGAISHSVGDFTVTTDISLTGTSNGSGYTQSANGSAKTLNMGSGTWTISSASSCWSLVSSCTLNCQTSTLKFNSNGTGTSAYSVQGKTYNNIWVSGSNTSNHNFTGSFACANLKIDAGKIVNFDGDATATFDSIDWQGSAGNLITIGRNGSGVCSIASTGAVMSGDYWSISNIVATTADTWYAGTHSTDGGGNTNINFTIPPSGVLPLNALTLQDF